MTRCGVCLLVFSLLMLLGGGSAAYHIQHHTPGTSIPVTWAERRIVMNLCPVSFPEGHWTDDALMRAMSTWNAAGAHLEFRYTRNSCGFVEEDGVNNVLIASQSYWRELGGDDDTLGITFYEALPNSQRKGLRFRSLKRTKSFRVVKHMELIDGVAYYTDADLVFNPDSIWADGAIFGYYDFESVVLHELGHVLGLDHEDRGPAVMNSYLGDGETVRTLYADDLAGLDALYGAPGRADLDILSFSADLPASPVGGDLVPFTVVVRNHGETGANSLVTVYARDDRGVLWPAGSVSVSCAGYEQVQAQGSGVLPEGVPQGYMSLLARVDPTDSVAEFDEGNNGAVAAEFWLTSEWRSLFKNKASGLLGPEEVLKVVFTVDGPRKKLKIKVSKWGVALITAPDGSEIWLGTTTEPRKATVWSPQTGTYRAIIGSRDPDRLRKVKLKAKLSKR
jgi:hypothetical protein